MLHSIGNYNYFGDLEEILDKITDKDLLVVISDDSIDKLGDVNQIYIPDDKNSLVYIVKGLAVRILTIERNMYITNVKKTSISPVVLSCLIDGYINNSHPLNILETLESKNIKVDESETEILIEYLEPYTFNSKSIFSLEDSMTFPSKEFSINFNSVYALYRLKCLKDIKSVDNKFIKKMSGLKTINSINKSFIDKEISSELNKEVDGHSIKFRLMVDIMYEKMVYNKDKFEEMIEEIGIRPLYYDSRDDYFGISKTYKGENQLGRIIKIVMIKFEL
jgi:hypothetical protein